jgi:hypothetical protein
MASILANNYFGIICLLQSSCKPGERSATELHPQPPCLACLPFLLPALLSPGLSLHTVCIMSLARNGCLLDSLGKHALGFKCMPAPGTQGRL